MESGAVGRNVGLDDGARDGRTVGESDGVWDGSEEGDALGDTVGVWVGKASSLNVMQEQPVALLSMEVVRLMLDVRTPTND